MNDERIPPIPFWIKKQVHKPCWSLRYIIKSLFRDDLEVLIKKINKCKYVVLTDSGSTALTLGLKYLKNKRSSDKVMMPSYCCKSVANAIISAGLRPHFNDVNLKFQPQLGRTKVLATVVPHFHEMKSPIKQFRGVVIEDKAQRMQDPLRGKFGILSFNIGKQVQSTGGGALVTDDKRLADFVSEHLGVQGFWQTTTQLINYLLMVNLRPLTFFVYNILNKTGIVHREEDITKRYEAVNKKEVTFQPKKINFIQKKLTQSQLYNSNPIFTQKTRPILVKCRYLLMQELAKKGIESEWVNYPLHLQKKYQKYTSEDLTNTEKIWKQTIITRKE